MFEHHKLSNNLSACRKFYSGTMSEGENVLPYINRVKKRDGVLKPMNVEVDETELEMAVLNGLPSSSEHLLVALDAVGNNDSIFTLDFVES